MTAESWLAAREPAPPPALAARMAALVAEVAPGEPLPVRLARAGEDAVARLLRDGCTTRESALDLLAADALVTYAFEAAAEAPEQLERLAAESMARIARIPARSGA